MIIKGKRGQTPASLSRKSEQTVAAPSGQPAPPEPEIVWNEETVLSGTAPERRQSERRDDRRRDYRRIEDKNLISKAYEEATAIKERAHEEGFHEGLAQSEAALADLKDQFETILKDREEALQSIANEMGALAVEIAARIIKTEVSCDETLVMGLVRDTIQKMGRNPKSVLVKVHPGDVTHVKKALKEEPITNLNAEIMVMEDSAVDLGSCVVETNSGLIDASFKTQLGVLRQLLGATTRGGSA